MRLRPGHIVLVVCLLIGGIVLYAVMTAPPPADIAVAPAARPGSDTALPPKLPPVDTDQEMVPQIHVPTTEFDMGVVPNDRPTTMEMPISNVGRRPLVIKDVATNCGCTIGVIENKTIAPGESEPLLITAYPDRVHDFYSRKTLTITSNSATNSVVRIDVPVHIDPEFSLEPRELAFGNVQKGDVHEGTILLRQEGEESINLLKVRPTAQMSAGLDVSYEERPREQWAREDRPEYLIKVRLLPEVAVGSLNAPLDVETTCARVPMFRAHVTAEVDSFYTVVPADRLVVNPRPDGRPGANSIVVSSKQPFEITNLAVSSPEFSARPEPGPEPNSIAIQIEVSPDASPGRKNETVTFDVSSNGRTVPNAIVLRGYVRDVSGG